MPCHRYVFIVFAAFSIASCTHSGSSSDISRNGSGGVSISKAELSRDIFQLDVKLTPYLMETDESIIKRGRGISDFYAVEYCKTMGFSSAVWVSGRASTEGSATRAWTFIYTCTNL